MTDADRVLDEGAQPLTDDDACSQALQRLWGYLDKELTVDDEDELRDHLAGCPPCLAEYSIDVVLKNLVRRSCHEEAPETLRVRIRQTLLQVRVEGR
ncbi:MAG TPA: mycothiol system anti-sigma-R factor [Cellulomonas sp.]